MWLKIRVFWVISLSLKMMEAILVNSSVEMNKFVRPFRPYPRFYQTLKFEVNPSIYTGFLLVFKNNMEMNPENCHLLDDLAIFQLNGRNISLSCTHYLIHFAESPLIIRLVPAIYESFKEFISVVITGVRLGCTEKDVKFKKCDNQPYYCIPRRLFCDGNDNCGMGSDERQCQLPPRRIPLLITDSRTQKHVAIILGSLAVVSFFIGIVCLAIYRWYQRARRGYCSKYVKNMFGQKKDQSNFEAEETVALLTLGLKNMYLPLPGRRLSHYHNVKYGTAW